MQKTPSIVCALATLAVAGCSNMGAQIKTSGAMGSEDTSYITTTYELAQLDNEAGKLVPAKAQDPRVVNVSSELVDQANALSPGLTDALKAEGITPPNQPPPDVAAEVAKLQTLSGTAFDHEYVADEIALHKKAVAVLQKEQADTKNAAMLTQVQAELPAVQNDLAALQSLTTVPNLTFSPS